MGEMKNMMGLIIITMVIMEIMDVTCNTLSKAAMAKGLSSYVFTTYSHGIAFFFLIPSALLFHRNTPVPPIGLNIICRLFLLGCVCGGCSIFLSVGVRYSSPTLASALNNLSPATTFLMGVIFRMESLNPRAQSSLLKLMGTVVSITGAFIVTFYQGLPIVIFSTMSPTESLSLPSLLRGTEQQQDWVLGGLFLFASSIFLSLSFVVKTWIARDFPSEVLITLIFFFFETIVAALVTFVLEEDTSVWTPTAQIMWIALLFGALEVGVVNIVQTWVCRMKGPLFVAMFKPLQMIIAVIMGVSFLSDVLHLGSVIGGTVIALGFYTVMKGKAEEEESPKVEDTSPDKVPLLQSRSIDV